MNVSKFINKIFNNLKTVSKQHNLIGLEAVVLEDIGSNSAGKVSLGESWWIAESKKETIKAGEKVRIDSVNGYKLIVYKI